MAHLLTVVRLGRYGRSPDECMAVNRSLPDWVVGLSMFGSDVSSIPFLANHGRCFRDSLDDFADAMGCAAVAAQSAQPNLTIVTGTLTIFLVGLAASQIRAPARAKIVE